MRESWTDARLDDLNGKVDDLGRRVDHLGRRLDDLGHRMDNGFNRVDDHFHAMQRTMIQAAVAMSAAFITGFAALIGLIATQL